MRHEQELKEHGFNVSGDEIFFLLDFLEGGDNSWAVVVRPGAVPAGYGNGLGANSAKMHQQGKGCHLCPNKGRVRPITITLLSLSWITRTWRTSWSNRLEIIVE